MRVSLWLLALYSHQACCIIYARELMEPKHKIMSSENVSGSSMIEPSPENQKLPGLSLFLDDISTVHQ